MKKIINQKPISVNGRDCLELLVRDDCASFPPCYRCWYEDWKPDSDLLASCSEVHGCSKNGRDYFVII